MSIIDEFILDVVTLDEVEFVAFCYMCSLLALCVVFSFPKGVLVFKLCTMHEVIDDPYVFLIP